MQPILLTNNKLNSIESKFQPNLSTACFIHKVENAHLEMKKCGGHSHLRFEPDNQLTISFIRIEKSPFSR
jgi:hypothetical protein